MPLPTIHVDCLAYCEEQDYDRFINAFHLRIVPTNEYLDASFVINLPYLTYA